MEFSLAMIVKNEEKVLKRCLESVKNLFDEIIIVDTGSTDNTKKIAKEYTNKIYDFVWVDDFSKARNFSFEKATKDYIMWLDADDILRESEQKAFIKLKPDVVMMKYNVSFDKFDNPTFSYFRERIVKKSCNFVWQDPIHEVIAPAGKIIYSSVFIEHRPYAKPSKEGRNLKIYESLLKNGANFSARQQYYYSRELMYNNKTNNAILNFQKFLSMPSAWIENKVSACIDLCRCYLSLNDQFSAKKSLLKSFEFTFPRAQICCMLADIFMQESKFDIAIYWYKCALKDKENSKSGAFVENTYYNVYPLLNLCVCYYKLGNYKKAELYNLKAGKFAPQNKYYLENLKFFESLKQKQNSQKWIKISNYLSKYFLFANIS